GLVGALAQRNPGPAGRHHQGVAHRRGGNGLAGAAGVVQWWYSVVHTCFLAVFLPAPEQRSHTAAPATARGTTSGTTVITAGPPACAGGTMHTGPASSVSV